MDRLTEKTEGMLFTSLVDMSHSTCEDECAHLQGGDCSTCVIEKALDKLRQFEDAEEQGRLVVLPCAVGDKLYEPRPDREGLISVYDVKEIGIGRDGAEFLYWTLLDGVYTNLNGVEADKIGKSVFLTKEAAEAALSVNT